MPYHEGDPQNNHQITQGMHPTWRCGGCGYTIISRAEGYCLFCERGLLKPESTRPHGTLYGTRGLPDALPPPPGPGGKRTGPGPPGTGGGLLKANTETGQGRTRPAPGNMDS